MPQLNISVEPRAAGGAYLQILALVARPGSPHRSADKNMRTLNFLLLILALSLLGCSRQPTAGAGPSPSEGQMITAFGEYPAMGGAFTVRVSESDGKLEVVRGRRFDVLTATNPATGDITVARNAAVTNTYSTAGWQAQSGWFVFVQDESRVWAYDGDQYLWLLTVDAAGNSGSYGPRSFPFPVPEQVLQRVPESVRKRIEIHAR